MRLAKVVIGEDGITAIFVNGEFYRSGDYYHDKIDDWYEGFKSGLSYVGMPFKEEDPYYLDDDDGFCEEGVGPEDGEGLDEFLKRYEEEKQYFLSLPPIEDRHDLFYNVANVWECTQCKKWHEKKEVIEKEPCYGEEK